MNVEEAHIHSLSILFFFFLPSSFSFFHPKNGGERPAPGSSYFERLRIPCNYVSHVSSHAINVPSLQKLSTNSFSRYQFKSRVANYELPVSWANCSDPLYICSHYALSFTFVIYLSLFCLYNKWLHGLASSWVLCLTSLNTYVCYALVDWFTSC